MTQNFSNIGVTACIVAATLGGCAVPSFDIPKDKYGQPTLKTIVDRIECELVAMVRDPRVGQEQFKHKAQLLAGNYVTTMNLTVKVVDTGEFSPSFNFPTVGPTLAVNAGFKFSQARTHELTKKLIFSMRNLYERSKDDEEFGKCADGFQTNLAGRLGLQRMVALNFSAPYGDLSVIAAKGGTFGGEIKFEITKNLNSTGPTWTLVNFVGPGKFAKFETTSTNKIVFAFTVSDVQPGVAPTPGDISAAERFLDQLLRDDR